MKRKIIITALFIAVIMSIAVPAACNYKFYQKLVKREKIGRIREFWNEDLTCEILQNRGDDIIVEKIIGTVVNKRKDGKIMNPLSPDHDYISYRCVNGAKKGDVILTICIYTPGNSYEDDVCERFDYIIDRETR